LNVNVASLTQNLWKDTREHNHKLSRIRRIAKCECFIPDVCLSARNNSEATGRIVNKLSSISRNSF